MSKLEGVIPALITPFKENGELFIEGIRNQIEYLNDFGYKNIFAGGSYSSFPLISPEERIIFNHEVIHTCKEFDMKSIIHIGSANTSESIFLAEEADNEGANIISSVVPYYYSSTFYNEDIVLKYYKKLVRSTSIDLHCYNNEKATGFGISTEFFKKLIGIGVTGIKDGNSSNERILEMVELCDKNNIDYYPSSTSSLIDGFLLGCKSCISGLSLSFPDLVMSIYDLIKEQRIFEAVENYKILMKIRLLMNSKKIGRASIAYSLMKINGVDVGTCREPWIRLTTEEESNLLKELNEIY